MSDEKPKKPEKPEKPAKPEKPVKVDLWQQFKQHLTTPARKAVVAPEPPKLRTAPEPVVDEPVMDFAMFRSSLTQQAKGSLDEQPAIEDESQEPHNDKLARYCLVEVGDGDDGKWPQVRLFQTPEGIARRIGSNLGKDMVIWAFFGVPLHLTQGEQRYLSLPDGLNSIMIPIIEGGPTTIVSGDQIENIPVQEDGFIGPKYLAETTIPEKEKPKPPPPVQNTAPDDEDADDEDDDDDDDEEGADA